MRHQNDNIKKEQQKIPAVLIEVDRKGYLQRYALTPKEFRETFAERLGTDMPTSQDKWQIYELRPMVQLWYCNATVGDELWNTFFTDMEYGLSEGDIESGNLATVEHSEMKLLSPYVPVKTGHDSSVYYTVQAADSGSMEKKRLFVDMDGTLAVFTPVDEMETLYQEGYFLNQKPHENVVEGIRLLMTEYKDIDVYILSSYLTDSKYALNEKNEWLDRYLPEIDPEHRIFVPYGKDKADWIEGGIDKYDYLLDDYTKNLVSWQESGSAVKLLNAINGSRGSWTGDKIRFDRQPIDFAKGIGNTILCGTSLDDMAFDREEIFTECKSLIDDLTSTMQYKEELLRALHRYDLDEQQLLSIHDELNQYIAEEEAGLNSRKQQLLKQYPELQTLFDEKAAVLFMDNDTFMKQQFTSGRETGFSGMLDHGNDNLLQTARARIQAMYLDDEPDI